MSKTKTKSKYKVYPGSGFQHNHQKSSSKKKKKAVLSFYFLSWRTLKEKKGKKGEKKRVLWPMPGCLIYQFNYLQWED